MYTKLFNLYHQMSQLLLHHAALMYMFRAILYKNRPKCKSFIMWVWILYGAHSLSVINQVYCGRIMLWSFRSTISIITLWPSTMCMIDNNKMDGWTNLWILFHCISSSASCYCLYQSVCIKLFAAITLGTHWKGFSNVIIRLCK